MILLRNISKLSISTMCHSWWNIIPERGEYTGYVVMYKIVRNCQRSVR